MVEPEIPGEPFGDSSGMRIVLVATRLQGDSLFPINTFPDRPVPVYVAKPLVEDAQVRTSLAPNELEVFAWAELYSSEGEARAKMTRVEAQKIG